MRNGFVVVALMAALVACTPVQPTPPPSNNTNTTNVVLVVGGPAGPTVPTPTQVTKPKLVKVTQFGETCPADSGKTPSGQDRAVRVGCSKALTCSPKCDNPQGGPDIDCPVPQGAAPDEFRVFAGADRISFTASSSNPAFNRDARGVAPGTASIDCTYAGVRSEPFDLLVTP
jgi:hypothetical protein